MPFYSVPKMSAIQEAILIGKKLNELHGKIIFWLVFMLVASMNDAFAGRLPMSWEKYVQEANKIGAGQLLLVLTSRKGEAQGQLYCLEKQNGKWKMGLEPMACSVGRNGIADDGAKREGDGMSPWGTFKIGFAFGYDEECETRMPYKQMHENDIWVDDLKASDYNQLTKKELTNADSFECMRRKDELYRKGLVVEYNTEERVPGYGSAIFIHFWGRPFNTTSGCVGLPMHHLEAVLRFLEPDKTPAIGFYRRD